MGFLRRLSAVLDEEKRAAAKRTEICGLAVENCGAGAFDAVVDLSRLPIGERASVVSLDGLNAAEKRRMLGMGLAVGTMVEALYKSPSGDPTAYFIRGTVLALRLGDAKKIWIRHNNDNA